MHRIDYIGWAGHGNAGDEACLEVVRRWLPGYQVEQTDRPAAPLCLVGGGTLLGLPQYQAPAIEAIRRGAAIAVCGTGIDLADPLERWEADRRDDLVEILTRARLVGLRGPISREVAASLDRHTETIGDPGLLMCGAPHGRESAPDGRESAPDGREPAGDGVTQEGNGDLVLLNAGSELPPPGGRARVLRVFETIARSLHRRGLRVEYLPLRQHDLDAGRPLIEAADLPTVPCELPAILQRISAARLVVSLRLHGAIFAAAAGVPFVSIGYHPKHRDFAASIGWPVFASRDLTAGPLLAFAREIDRHAATVRRELLAHVSAYRRRLDRFAAGLQALAKEVYRR